MTDFLTSNYAEIQLMAQKITKGNSEWEDVCHYAIEEFIQHPRAEELILQKKGMQFLSGIIHRSFHSSTSRYHKIYRQKGRVHPRSTPETPDETYDYGIDRTVTAIEGILEEMLIDHDVELWYQAHLFKMWMDEPNYSEIARKTGIPRTSISAAVNECKEYIKQQLEKRNIL